MRTFAPKCTNKYTLTPCTVEHRTKSTNCLIYFKMRNSNRKPLRYRQPDLAKMVYKCSICKTFSIRFGRTHGTQQFILIYWSSRATYKSGDEYTYSVLCVNKCILSHSGDNFNHKHITIVYLFPHRLLITFSSLLVLGGGAGCSFAVLLLSVDFCDLCSRRFTWLEWNEWLDSLKSVSSRRRRNV